ncbi:site-specific integrase [Krasilnikovia sp. MM14-A1004]|uniref:site-specific integrase n=1 Tax=Krasilnikovia sp. MM14-A1004 TaxID=3373541 RepID=UPI00399C8EB6
MQDEQDIPVHGLIGEFLAARATSKPSAHTLAAYRRDLEAVLALVAEHLAAAPGAVVLADLSPRVLRAGFAAFAAGRAPASVYRGWSTWNSFFRFLVGDGIAVGNPMPAVDKPRLATPSPKPLRGEDTPERLLDAVRRPDARQRDPWACQTNGVTAVSWWSG